MTSSITLHLALGGKRFDFRGSFRLTMVKNNRLCVLTGKISDTTDCQRALQSNFVKLYVKTRYGLNYTV